MKLTIAYGLPGAGKTTLLKSLRGKYLDYDSPHKRHKVKALVESLDEGEYILDFMLFEPNEFAKFYFNIYPEGKLKIYNFKENRTLSNLRDKKRGRKLLSTNIIDNMQLKTITNNNNSLEVVEI